MKIEKPYFKKANVGDKVFGLVFGRGTINNTFGDAYYTFEVEYENGQVVPYTSEGNPAWNFGADIQTLFYADEINLAEYDMTPIDEVLTAKKIIKLRNKNKLEVRCLSGIWRNIKNCPATEVETLLSDAKFHRFRKAI